LPSAGACPGVSPTIAVSVVIDALPAAVWSVLEPIERHVDWMADAEAIDFTTEQTRGAGTTFICLTKVGPIRLRDAMEITEWTPNHAMGVRHDGLVTGVGRFTLSQCGPTRTRFIWREQLTFPWWLGGPLGAVVGGQLVLRAIWKRNLRTLKALVEARSAA
jgi:Polyketide cyclase / dehydrase and lipid transport